VPASRIPQPAKLKAPRGTPAQEAAVVWHQLLVARHLLFAKRPVASAENARRPFPQPTTVAAAGESPLRIAEVRPTAARVATPRSGPLWAGAGIAGAVFALSAGAFVVRRRRRSPGEGPG
jgi:hypothetical protein